MISTLRFESSRVFTRTTTVSLLLLIIASLYFTFLGVSGYRQFLQDKKSFIASEKDKIKLYVNYEQYGAVGFRVLLEPSPLVVFFSKSDFVQHLEANVDASE
ncbi:MAG: hypothetical protein GY950_31485, partial [bacterium]|nr:hypothetical protein [bacterium]